MGVYCFFGCSSPIARTTVVELVWEVVGTKGSVDMI